MTLSSPHQSHLWISIVTEPSNLNFSITLSLNGAGWTVIFTNNYIKATSHETFPVPGKDFNEKDRAIENAMNQIVGHIRNLGYFSLGIDMKWGYEGGYDGTHISALMDIFPTIHQNGSVRFNQQYLERAQRILKDIGNSRRRGLRSLLNYWRRAKELDELGFDQEAYLNYFKILECLTELNKDQQNKRDIIARFSPRKVPQKTLCKRYGANTTKKQESLHKQIVFVAKALSAAGISKEIRRSLFIKVLDIVYMRHGWNVAHKLLRTNPYDTYDTIGQHSDEFRLVMIENAFISRITKLLILRYVKPGKYHFASDGNMPMVMPISGKGSNLD